MQPHSTCKPLCRLLYNHSLRSDRRTQHTITAAAELLRRLSPRGCGPRINAYTSSRGQDNEFSYRTSQLHQHLCFNCGEDITGNGSTFGSAFGSEIIKKIRGRARTNELRLRKTSKRQTVSHTQDRAFTQREELVLVLLQPKRSPKKGAHTEQTTAVSPAGTVHTVVLYTHTQGKGTQEQGRERTTYNRNPFEQERDRDHYNRNPFEQERGREKRRSTTAILLSRSGVGKPRGHATSKQQLLR